MGADDSSGAPGSPATESADEHPTARLDEIVHQRHRLGILAIASRSREADFGYLRDALSLTSGNLSTHLSVLEDAGLIRVEKGYVGRRPRTWVSITRPGRDALEAELAALRRLVRQHDGQREEQQAGGGSELDD